ncbi:MAG: DUF1847 domain-containing protein [Mailhella sp.]|nr:DUF1847 domain-containing protein [Mailhella sp.]
MPLKNPSCVNCPTVNCNFENRDFPPFCLSMHATEEQRRHAREEYGDENLRILITATDIEFDGAGRWPRVRETIEFARRMGYTKLGIATCVGLMHESAILAKLLKRSGFEVFSVACKVGLLKKTEMGIPACRTGSRPNLCNPVLQADFLNSHGTELNIVMGLCVGHDIIFSRYSKAGVTTLVTKDRVTGHNPAAALYGADGYFKRMLEIPE